MREQRHLMKSAKKQSMIRKNARSTEKTFDKSKNVQSMSPKAAKKPLQRRETTEYMNRYHNNNLISNIQLQANQLYYNNDQQEPDELPDDVRIYKSHVRKQSANRAAPKTP